MSMIPYTLANTIERAVANLPDNLKHIGNGLHAIAQSIDNVAKAYARANPPEDK